MKLIPLTQGYFAMVDDEDYKYLCEYKWRVDKQANTNYAARRNGKQTTYYMHRQILNTPPDKEVDHINNNGLDNRRENLRICTLQQNKHNQKIRNDRKYSQYKGVTFRKDRKKWKAQIGVNNRHIHLGHFNKEIDAAVAYNEAAKQYFGEFAKINRIENA